MTSALELHQVSKVYGSGPSEVRALHAVDLAVERGELEAGHGAERLRQEHAPDDRRQPGSRNQRPIDSVNGEAVMRLLRAATQRAVAGGVVTHEAQLASWDDRCLLRDGLVVDQTVAPPGPESLLAAVIGDGDAWQKGGTPSFMSDHEVNPGRRRL